MSGVADHPALCRRRRPETVERDVIGAWLSSRLRSVRSPVAPTALEAMLMIVVGLDVSKELTANPSGDFGALPFPSPLAAAFEPFTIPHVRVGR